jgi:hypothetical protein
VVVVVLVRSFVLSFLATLYPPMATTLQPLRLEQSKKALVLTGFNHGMEIVMKGDAEQVAVGQ